MSNIYFLEGTKTRLRLVKEEDTDFMLIGINDQEMLQFIQSYLPVPRAKEMEWIQKVMNPTPTDIVFVVETKGGERLGVMGLHTINHLHGTCMTGALFTNKLMLGQGYGVDAKFALLHYAFMTLNMRKVCSAVKANNPRSRAYQERNGYRHVGTRVKQFYVNGEYVDEYLMEVWRHDFIPLYEAHMTS